MVPARAVAMLVPASTARPRLRVVRDRDGGQPGVVGVEISGGQVGQRAVDEFGEDLLDDRVPAVVGLGLHEHERAVGEHGVVAPDGNSTALIVWCGRAFVGHAAHKQPGVTSCRVRRRGEADLGDVGAGDEPLLLFVPDRPRLGDLDPRLTFMA
jgi:hypothetical protein